MAYGTDTYSPLQGAFDAEEQARRAAYPNTGIVGANAGADVAATRGLDAPSIQAPAEPAAAATPDYTKLGKYASQLEGYDMGKFNRAYGDMNEKYKLGLVQSHFDPTQGVTPEYLAALNSLGIADFSGQGDKLTARNPKNGQRVRMGTGGTGDVVKGLKSGDANFIRWKPWLVDDGSEGGGGVPAAGAAPADLAGPGFGASLGQGSSLFEQLMQQIRQTSGTSDTNEALRAALRG